MTFPVHMLTAAAVRSSVRPGLIADGLVRLRVPAPGGTSLLALPPPTVSNYHNDSQLTI